MIDWPQKRRGNILNALGWVADDQGLLLRYRGDDTRAVLRLAESAGIELSYAGSDLNMADSLVGFGFTNTDLLYPLNQPNSLNNIAEWLQGLIPEPELLETAGPEFRSLSHDYSGESNGEDYGAHAAPPDIAAAIPMDGGKWVVQLDFENFPVPTSAINHTMLRRLGLGFVALAEGEIHGCVEIQLQAASDYAEEDYRLRFVGRGPDGEEFDVKEGPFEATGPDHTGSLALVIDSDLGEIWAWHNGQSILSFEGSESAGALNGMLPYISVWQEGEGPEQAEPTEAVLQLEAEHIAEWVPADAKDIHGEEVGAE